MTKRHAPAASRNRDALLDLLRRVLPASGRVLELGSGTGEHAVHCAAHLPGLVWQPSDPDPASRDSIAAWTAEAGLPNVLPPLQLDLLARAWRLQRADAIVVVNVLHVAPPGAGEALLAGAAQALPPGGRLVVAGPGAEALPPLAGAHDLVLVEEAPLPEGTIAVVLRRR
jgi:SAM-dependent methyltransferase